MLKFYLFIFGSEGGQGVFIVKIWPFSLQWPFMLCLGVHRGIEWNGIEWS